jgi:hypothetical protein
VVFREKLTMDKFEEIGRRLDEEVTRLFPYIEEEVALETERRTASFLRTFSAKAHGSGREVGGSPEIKTRPIRMFQSLPGRFAA